MTDFTLPYLIGAGLYDSSHYRTVGRTADRCVECYELELALDADSRGVVHIDSSEYPIEPDMIVVAKPGQIRFSELPYRCAYLHIADSDSPICRELSNLPDVIHLSDVSPLRSHFAAATSEPLSHGTPLEPDGSSLGAYSHLLAIIAFLSSSVKDVRAQRALPPIVSSAIAYIDANPDRIPRLDEIAAEIHASPIYLHRVFTRAMTLTPYRFILERRLAEAKRLLADRKLSCQQIAARLGFASASYFTSVFRRELGISPSEYRRKSDFEI